METNIFSAYMKFEQLPDEVKRRNNIKVGAKVPRLDLTRLAGYYKPLQSLTNKNGQIFIYIQEAKDRINSPDERRAERYLQGKDSLNLSSVYLLRRSTPESPFVGYGNPDRSKTFSKSHKPNPFYECRDDGFLFLIAPDWQTIEILVVTNGYNTIQGNAKGLADGAYNEALETMREAAKSFYQY